MRDVFEISLRTDKNAVVIAEMAIARKRAITLEFKNMGFKFQIYNLPL
jgi:hypothetical protein